MTVIISIAVIVVVLALLVLFGLLLRSSSDGRPRHRR